MKNEYFNEMRITDRKIGGSSFFSVEFGQNLLTYVYESPFHYHNWCEMYYMKKGSCIYSIDNVKYNLGPGDLVLVRPGAVHKVFYTDADYDRVLIYFTKDFISTSLIDKLNSIAEFPVCRIDESSRDFTQSIFKRLNTEFRKPDMYSNDVCKNMIYELMLNFVRNPSEYNGNINSKTNMLVDHMVRYIDHNYDRCIRLKDLAEIGDVSTSHLSRVFKRAMGVNITDYIRKVRLENAKIMLRETTEKIIVISERCGFNDSTYFSRIFQQSEKISPLKYRKLYS